MKIKGHGKYIAVNKNVIRELSILREVYMAIYDPDIPPYFGD